MNFDFDAGYRPKAEYEEWLNRDCLTLQRERLIQQGIGEKEITEIETQIDKRARECVRLAQEAAFPPPEELQRGVFYEGS